MSSVRSDQSKQPVRQFVSSAPFHQNIFAYRVIRDIVTGNSNGTLVANITGANSKTCPSGRILRENGKKLYPAVNSGVSTYMIGVIDSISGISGFIDPNSPVFALYSTDLPATFEDGVDPGPQGYKDVGPPVYTNGSIYAAINATIKSTLTTSTANATIANVNRGYYSTFYGSTLIGSTINVSTLNVNNGYYSTFYGSTLTGSTINVSTLYVDRGYYSMMEGDILNGSIINVSTLNMDSGYFSTFYGSSLIVSSITASTIDNVQTLNVNHEFFSTSYGSTLTGSTINVSSIYIEAAFFSTVIGSTIECDSISVKQENFSSLIGGDINTSTITVQELTFSSILGGNMNISSINVQKLTFSSILGGDMNTSSITVNQMTFSSLIGGVMNTSTITVNQLRYSSLVGNNITTSTMTTDLITMSSIQGTNVNASTITTSSITINGQSFNPLVDGTVAGIISMYAGSSDPAGWYICDGRSLSRTSHSKLFTAIGTTYGSVDGGSFSIPDLRNQFIVGVGSGYGLNAKGGASTISLSIDQLPAHTHAVNDPGHGHTIGPYPNSNSSGAEGTEWGGGSDESSSTGTANNNTTGITISSTGSGASIENRPPYTALNYIIKY